MTAITETVNHALQRSSTSASAVQFVPDPTNSALQVHGGLNSNATATIHESVSTVMKRVIGTQDPPGSKSNSTFLSEATPLPPLSHREPDSYRVKTQIWANECADLALLLHSSISYSTEEYNFRVETYTGAQPSSVLRTIVYIVESKR